MKYFLGVLGAVLLIIFVFVLVLSGGSNNDKTPATQVKALTEYASEPSTTATYTMEGPITAEENFRAVRITVGPSIREVELLDGYTGRAEKRKTYPNTESSFEAFLAGIEQAGFTNDRKSSHDFKSVCPTGRRFSYKLVSADDTVVDTWSATCERGTFGGQTTMSQNLFQAQIPDYDKFLRGVRFTL